jgi:predicted RecB family nuclease
MRGGRTFCDFCEYSQQCQDTWRAADSLEYVAGIRRKEKEAFEDADIATVVGLAEVNQPTPLVSAARQDRLRRQAELQVVSRARPNDPPAFWPVPPADDPVWGHGYANLPEPDAGDVNFDLEGHPFWTASSGLFFLFGLWYQMDSEWIYEARWAHELGLVLLGPPVSGFCDKFQAAVPSRASMM